MRSVLLMAAAAAALVATEAVATAPTCSPTIIATLDDTAGPTYNCVNKSITALSTLAHSSGLPALTLSAQTVFTNPANLIASPFGQASILAIFLTAMQGVLQGVVQQANGALNQFATIPTCVGPKMYNADGSVKTIAQFTGNAYADCGANWTIVHNGVPQPSGTAFSTTDMAIADLALHLFGLTFAENVFAISVPCVPQACAGVALSICQQVGVNGVIPSSFSADIQQSSFARLSAAAVGFGKSQAVNITGWLDSATVEGGVVQGILHNLPAVYGGPITGTTFTINCTAFFGNPAAYGGGLTSAPTSASTTLKAGAATAFASLAAAALSA